MGCGDYLIHLNEKTNKSIAFVKENYTNTYKLFKNTLNSFYSPNNDSTVQTRTTAKTATDDLFVTHSTHTIAIATSTEKDVYDRKGTRERSEGTALLHSA